MDATLSTPGSEGIGSAWAVGVLHWHKKNQKTKKQKRRNGEKNGEWEAEVSSAEADYDGGESEHCCWLDFLLNEFGIISETSGENICINELLLRRKGVYQLPQVRLIRHWLGSLVFSCCLRCESWNTVEKNEDFEILLGNTVKCCRSKKHTMHCMH